MDRIRHAVSRAKVATPPKQEAPAAPVQSRPAAVDLARPNQVDAPDAVTEATSPLNLPVFQADQEVCEGNRVIANEQDPVLSAYRVLRTRVLQRMEKNNWRTLGLVSPTSGAGKTVTAVNLAIAVGSKQGSRATLADFDFYRPRVAEYLGLKNPPSILDFMEGKKSLREIALHASMSDVVLLANERVSRRGAEYLTSPKVEELFEAALTDFQSRIVICDLPPLLGCDDTISFLPKVDCALVVTASDDTKTDELAEAKKLLGTTPIVGTILNKAPIGYTANPYY